VVSTVSVIAVTYDNTNSKYTITVNGINLGNNPTLYLTPGETYNFNLNVVGHGFYIVTTSGAITSPYTTGLQGTPGTEVTNSSTKFIWTVPLNTPSELFYQDGVTLGNFGKIAINPVGTSGRIAIANNSIDLVAVTQTDTNGTPGINFVQSVTRDAYGRVTGRVVADIRTASTTQTGIVQLNTSVNDTSTTTAATPSSVKAAYDLANQFKGTVTSVGLVLPNIFTVNGSPVIGSGTLTGELSSQLANLIFASPASGSSAAPTFRSLVPADIPTIPSSKLSDKGQSGGVAELNADGLIPIARIPKSINISQISSTSIILGTEHNGLILETIASTSVTLTLPNNLSAGFNCIVVQKGAGQVIFTPSTGATLRHPDNHNRSARQYSSCTLYVSTNTQNNAEYILAGNTGV
jgi:hypothetical protein